MQCEAPNHSSDVIIFSCWWIALLLQTEGKLTIIHGRSDSHNPTSKKTQTIPWSWTIAVNYCSSCTTSCKLMSFGRWNFVQPNNFLSLCRSATKVCFWLIWTNRGLSDGTAFYCQLLSAKTHICTHTHTHAHTDFIITSGSFIILHHITSWPIVVEGRWQHWRSVCCVYLCPSTCLVCRCPCLVSGGVTWPGVPSCAKRSQLAATKQLVSPDKLPPAPGQTGNKPLSPGGSLLRGQQEERC